MTSSRPSEKPQLKVMWSSLAANSWGFEWTPFERALLHIARFAVSNPRNRTDWLHSHFEIHLKKNYLRLKLTSMIRRSAPTREPDLILKDRTSADT